VEESQLVGVALRRKDGHGLGQQGLRRGGWNLSRFSEGGFTCEGLDFCDAICRVSVRCGLALRACDPFCHWQRRHQPATRPPSDPPPHTHGVSSPA
jgi:hypothetical protein